MNRPSGTNNRIMNKPSGTNNRIMNRPSGPSNRNTATHARPWDSLLCLGVSVAGYRLGALELSPCLFSYVGIGWVSVSQCKALKVL